MSATLVHVQITLLIENNYNRNNTNTHNNKCKFAV